MSTFLRKYGAATHIYLPIVKRAVVDFAVSADWTPAAGDVKISKDGGAAANVTNLPTAITMGNTAMWDYSLTATEMEAAQVMVTVADSATKAVEDQFFIIETYGHASGQHAVDLDDGVRAGLTALPNVAFAGVGGLDSPIVDTGTAQAVAATSITLAAGAPSTMLEKNIVRIKSATTGAGQLNVIVDYNTTTKVADLQDTWEVTPTGTIVYEVLKYSSGVDPATPEDVAEAVSTNFDAAGCARIENINTKVGEIDVVTEALLALLNDARAEPAQGAPAVNANLVTKIDYLYKAWRNKKEQTATQESIYNDAGAVVDHKRTDSDDGTTLVKGEVATGP